MKRYPFSIQKHAHSIEFYYNHVKSTLHDMESGTIPMDTERYNRLSNFFSDELLPLYQTMFDSRDGRLVYLTGHQIGLAKKIVMWASERRADSLIRAKKVEYLEYC